MAIPGESLPSAPAPAVVEAPAVAPAEQTRQDLRALQQEILETNERETKELIDALVALRTYLDDSDSKASEGTKKAIRQEIQTIMALIYDIKRIEQSLPVIDSTKFQEALDRLNDAEQHFLALLPAPEKRSEQAQQLVTTLEAGFQEKRNAMERVLGKEPSTPVSAPAVESAPAEGTVPTAEGTPSAPEASATPEQTAHKEAKDEDTAASNAISEKIRTLSENFEEQMQALKATIPDIPLDIPLTDIDNQARAARESIDSIVRKFKTDKKGIIDALALADRLRGEGKFTEAKGAMDTVKTKFDAMLSKAEPAIEEKLKDEGVKSKLERVTILTNLKGLVATAKTDFPPLLATRNITLDGVATAKAALDNANQRPLEEATEVVTLAQQEEAGSETPDASPDTSTASGEKLTYAQFKEKINTAWEEISEGLNKGDVGAIIAGALAMLTLAISQFNTIASGSLDFLGDLTGKKEETPEGASEKPADKEAVLAQFGIENEGKQTDFFNLTLKDVARFIQRDGTPQAGETLSPTLIEFKARDNGTPYAQFKSQLDLNTLNAYVEALPAGEQQDSATLGEFIQSRVDNKAPNGGWKIA